MRVVVRLSGSIQRKYAKVGGSFAHVSVVRKGNNGRARFAERVSMLNDHGLSVAKHAIVLGNVVTRREVRKDRTIQTGKVAGSNEAMVTSQCGWETESIGWNMISSWKAMSVGGFGVAKMSTMKVRFVTTIGWRTWSLLTGQATSETTMLKNQISLNGRWLCV